MSEQAKIISEVERLREALTEIRDALIDHPAYADLTEYEEIDVGGDTGELSYLVRVANGALKNNVEAQPQPDPKVNHGK